MQDSKIEWTDHTFNPWWGCMKVSEGCKNCYAENLDNRYHKADPHWGPGSGRKAQSEAYWQQPIKWNAASEKARKPAKVFCASMGDVFEGHPDTLEHLERLLFLIAGTPYLTWQLLTKRPENIIPLLNKIADTTKYMKLKMGIEWWLQGLPPGNVWIGTSVEHQAAADARIPHLLKVPAKVRFLSCEPLLGPVDLMYELLHINCKGWLRPAAQVAEMRRDYVQMGMKAKLADNGIHWVIAGGESGPKARPVHPDWVRSLRDQCAEAGVAFFFKQWGEYGPIRPAGIFEGMRRIDFTDGEAMGKIGKKASGRLLDGVEHNAFPVLEAANR